MVAKTVHQDLVACLDNVERQVYLEPTERLVKLANLAVMAITGYLARMEETE